MSFSYGGNPLANALDEVRFLAQNTENGKPWTMQDEEINYAISQYGSSTVGTNALAAAIIAEQIVGRMKSSANSKRVGDLAITQGNQLEAAQDLARILRFRANMQVAPYAGGISISEKETQNQDNDRVQPAFQVDGFSMHRLTEANPPQQENNPFTGI